MNARSNVQQVSLLSAAVVVGLLSYTFIGTAAEPENADRQPAAVTVATARDRATLLQNTYLATLHVMHERYFHDERAIVPARALEDVFAELDRQSKVKARWISVNTKPMSVGHEPKTAFEKQAAKEIDDGQESVELVADGVYQRAVAIPLTSGCVSCHTGFFGSQPKSPRYAALVVTMPVTDEK